MLYGPAVLWRCVRWMVCVTVILAMSACASSRRAGARLIEGDTTPEVGPEVSEHGGVRRSRSRDGEHLLLRTSLSVGDWRIGLVGSPDVHSERIGLTLSSPRLDALFVPPCEVRVMVDGVLLGVLEHDEYRPARGRHDAMLAARLELSRLIAMAAGGRVAMRICGDEVRFGPGERRLLAEFLLQYQEEQRWRDPVEPQDLSAVPVSSEAQPEAQPEGSDADAP